MWYDVLDKLTADIADKIDSDAYSEDVPIFTERRGDLDNEVKRRLGALRGKEGKFGACIVIQAPVIKLFKAQGTRPILEAHLSILCAENPAINFREFGTKKTAAELGIASAHLLWYHEPKPFGSILLPSDPYLEPVEHTDAPVAYALGIHCRLQVADIPERLTVPTITVNQTNCPVEVAITCPNADAQIYWTIDDSYPSPKKAGATLYTVPFTVHESCNLRACARLLNYFDSPIACQTLT